MKDIGEEPRLWAGTRAKAAEWAAIVAIAAVAAALRLIGRDLIQFHFDDGRACLLAWRTLQGDWALAGLETTYGFRNPPLFVYLAAAAMALGRDPARIMMMIALMNVGAVIATWRVGRRVFGPGAGVTAAGLMAVAPAAVWASRRIYAQDCMALPAGLAVLVALRLVEGGEWKRAQGKDDDIETKNIGRRARESGALVFILGLAMQIHYSGALLAMGLGIGLLWARAAFSWRWAALGAAGAALPLIPFMVYLAQTGWVDLRAIAALPVQGSAVAATSAGRPWVEAWGLASDANVTHIFSTAYATITDRLPGYHGLRWTMNGLVVAAFVWIVARAIRGEKL